LKLFASLTLVRQKSGGMRYASFKFTVLLLLALELPLTQHKLACGLRWPSIN